MAVVPVHRFHFLSGFHIGKQQQHHQVIQFNLILFFSPYYFSLCLIRMEPFKRKSTWGLSFHQQGKAKAEKEEKTHYFFFFRIIRIHTKIKQKDKDRENEPVAFFVKINVKLIFFCGHIRPSITYFPSVAFPPILFKF